MPKKKSTTKRTTRSRRQTINVLFSCVGRRIELVRAFREAAEKLKINLVVHGSDMSLFAPAMHMVDHAHIVPPLDDTKHIDALLEIVRLRDIDLAIPLIDLELLALSHAWPQFDQLGCCALISSELVIQTCQDKLLTYRLLKSMGIDTPETWTADQALARKRHRFPYFLKPREGSAGQGNYRVDNLDELRVFAARVPNPIVQEFVDGIEHTLDVYTGFDGIPRCVVPRRRLEVRNGEVSKGVIVKDRRIMTVGRNVARALKDGRGVLTVQCIVTPENRIRVIEINPRFGGGAPLAIQAGADFPYWILSELTGHKVTIKPTEFKNRIAMLRYDDSVFCAVGKNWR